jgi:hypothetical protein
MFLSRGYVDLCGSTIYDLLSVGLMCFKAWVSNPQPADTFVNCLHANKFYNKLRC